jgi:hypothetical protein
MIAYFTGDHFALPFIKRGEENEWPVVLDLICSWNRSFTTKFRTFAFSKCTSHYFGFFQQLVLLFSVVEAILSEQIKKWGKRLVNVLAIICYCDQYQLVTHPKFSFILGWCASLISRFAWATLQLDALK